MLLANEINESGEPFAEALGYNLDDLDPALANMPDSVSYTLGIENYEYSRYQLGTIISRSGMGLHMMWAPVVRQMAAMQPDDFDGSINGMPNGYKEDDMLMKMIMHFSMLAHHAPPGNPWPQFADFMSADPHLPQAVDPQKFVWEDFSTLRWDRSKMDKILNPAAMGQSLMKQYLWAQDMLGSFHDTNDEGIGPTVRFPRISRVVRTLYSAYRATGKPRYAAAGALAYRFLIQKYYVPGEQVFRSNMSRSKAYFTPKNFAIIAGALREAALEGGFDEAPLIYTRFFKKIGNRMQLSEGGPTGESGNDSDGDGVPFIPEQPENLPPVFASSAEYEIAPAKASESERGGASG